MSLEVSIYTLLGPLVGNRVFPDTAPVNTVKPYITYQVIGGNLIRPLKQEIPNKVNSHIQINVWDTTRLAARNLERLVESTLVAATGITAKKLVESVYDYEPDLKLYGFRMEFYVWHDRS